MQNNKFAFLKSGDPFNPYYVAMVIANGGKPPAGSADAAGSSAKISGEPTVKPVKKAAAGVMPLEPPKPQYIVNRPAGAQPLDMDVIDTSWMDSNVQALRHNYFNVNRYMIDDNRDVILTKRRAHLRGGRLTHRRGNVWSFLGAPKYIVNA